jgi:hypothetical protein
VELSVVRTDADVHGRSAEVSRPLCGFSRKRFGDVVVCPFGEMWPVLLGRTNRDECEGMFLKVGPEVRPCFISEVHFYSEQGGDSMNSLLFRTLCFVVVNPRFER